MAKPILIAEAEGRVLEVIATALTDLGADLGADIVRCYSKPRFELALNRSPDGAVIVSRDQKPFGLDLHGTVCIISAELASDQSTDSERDRRALVRDVRLAVTRNVCPAPRRRRRQAKVLVLAGSTGAIPVLLAVLRQLDIRKTAVIVCQHIGRGHDRMLAERLAAESRSPVQLVSERRTLLPGVVHLLGGGVDWQLVRRNRGLEIEQDKTDAGHFHPSANAFMGSLLRCSVPDTLAVVLSGLGKDGAEHLRQLKAAGVEMIVQDPSDAVAGGMPSAAIATGAIGAILPTADIANYIEERTA